MDRSKGKKQAAAIYIPPSLRGQSKMDEMEDVKGTQPSPMVTVENSTNEICDVKISSKRKKENEARPGNKDSQTTEQKSSRGRGRGKRKPEMEVYVPRALRAAKQDLISKSDKQSEISKERNVPKDGKETNECMSENNVCNESLDSEIEKDKDIELQSGEPDPENFSDAVKFDTHHSFNDSNCSNSNDVHDRLEMPCANSGIAGMEPLTIETYTATPISTVSSVNSNGEHDGNVQPLTFEFYDPAVIAFLPSPKCAEENNFDYSNKEMQRSPHEARGENSQGNCNIKVEQTDLISTLDDNGDAASINTNISSCSHFQEEGKQITKNPSPALDIDEKSSGTSQLSHAEKMDTPGKKETKKELSFENECNFKCGSKAAEESTVGPDENLDDEDSWDALFDDNGDCLDDTTLNELTEFVGKVEIDKPKINYLNYTPKEPDLDMRAFGHIVEIYDFSSELATHDLITAFKNFSSRGFDIKWVDDTHALGVFSSTIAANEALAMIHPMLKVRPISAASKNGQSKAKHCSEFLQPYKARPETTSIAARRLVAGALGMTAQVPKEVREQERKKLKEAKEKRRRDRQQKSDIWDGSFGECAMDAEGDRR